MMKNIRFHTIAVLFAKLPTPKDNRCLHVDMRFSTFDIGSHVISCFRELSSELSTVSCIIIMASELRYCRFFWRLKFKQILKMSRI